MRYLAQHGAIKAMRHTHEVTFYKLDMTIALDYRDSKSKNDTKPIQWKVRHTSS